MLVIKKQRVTILLTLVLVVLFSLVFLTILNFLGFKPQFYKQQSSSNSSQLSESNYSASETTSPEPAIIDNTIKFDVEKVKVGDKIGSMTITDIGSKSGKATPNSAYVYFKGKVTLSGDFEYTKPGGYMGETLCMNNLDEQSSAKLPKMASDTRVVWFCFDNMEQAKKILLKNDEEQGGKTTIIIDNYTIFYQPSSIYNTADLISLSK